MGLWWENNGCLLDHQDYSKPSPLVVSYWIYSDDCDDVQRQIDPLFYGQSMGWGSGIGFPTLDWILTLNIYGTHMQHSCFCGCMAYFVHFRENRCSRASRAQVQIQTYSLQSNAKHVPAASHGLYQNLKQAVQTYHDERLL